MKKDKIIAFRPNPSQRQRIKTLCEATGLSQSEVLRSLVDSATLVARPVIVSTYDTTPPNQRGELVQHAQ